MEGQRSEDHLERIQVHRLAGSDQTDELGDEREHRSPRQVIAARDVDAVEGGLAEPTEVVSDLGVEVAVVVHEPVREGMDQLETQAHEREREDGQPQ